jgi:hypothetical protein
VEVLLGGNVVAQTLLKETREDVFDYHSRPGAIRCPNYFSVSLPRADLAVRFSYPSQRLQISLRALGPKAQPVIGVDIWLAKHILPSKPQLMTDRGMLDAEMVAQIRNDPYCGRPRRHATAAAICP